MAQVVNVAPIEIYRDEAMPRFIAALSTQIDTKRKQEEAMRQAKLKQNEDNARLFGEGAKNLQKYAEIDFLTPAVSNRLIQEGINKLTKSVKDNTAQADVPLLGVEVAQQIGALKNFKTNVESARTRIKELYPSVSDENITALANKYFYRQIENPDGTVTEDVNWNNLPNIQELILGEFTNNPSRYADLPALTNSMSRTIGGIKTTPFTESRKTDPTGRRTLSLGVKADRMPFEDIIDITDPDTGLKARVPGIRVVPFAGFNKPDGTPYNVISDNTFNNLISNADKSFPNMLNVKADGMMVDHNTQVIFDRLKEIESGKKKGEPKFSDRQIMEFAREQAVGAGANESVELEGAFPGFVNKYIPSNMDAFVRIAATKAVSDLGRYNPDGTLKVIEYDRGDVRDAAGSGGGGTAGAETPTIDLTGYVDGFLGNRRIAPFSAMGSVYRTAVMEQAKNDIGISSIGAGDIEIVRLVPTSSQPATVGYRVTRDIENASGDVVIKKGVSFPLDQSANISVSKKAGGQKAATAAMRQSATQGKVITTAEFRAMTPTERDKFIKAGGKHQ
jgi:hypothetical protein